MTTPAPIPPLSERRPRRDLLWGALLVALFTIGFLWGPIVRTDDVLVPASLGQRFSLTRVGRPTATTAPAAEAVADTWTRFVPWALFSRSEIRSGHLPTWNGLSAPGAPHLANLRAAVLSPFTLPWYLFEPRAAALASAFARLFLLGFFAFLFLREMRLAFAAAIGGAIVFQFAGANVVGLFDPQSATAVLAPAGLYLVERMARATDRALAGEGSARAKSWGKGLGTAAALAVTIALSFFAGSFDTFCFALLLVLAYALARWMRIGARERWSPDARREIGRATVHVVGALVVGTLLAGIQLLPWGEGLRYEAPEVAASEVATSDPLPLRAWSMQAFPDLLGSPTGDFQLPSKMAPPDHRAAIQEYVGSLALFLALLGVVAARRRHVGWFFAGAAVAWFAVAHGLLGRALLDVLLVRQLAPVQHGHVVFVISLAVLAALALDRIASSRRAPSSIAALSVALIGAALLWLLRENAETVAGQVLGGPPSGGEWTFEMLASRAHVEAISAAFCAGLLCLALAIAIPPGRWRHVLVVAAAASAFAQTGWLLRNCHPSAAQRFVYPRTESIEKLARLVRDKTFAVLGEDGIPPDTHLALGLRQLAADDPERTRRCDRLFRASFSTRGRIIDVAEARDLQLFGVEFVLEKNRWDEADLHAGSGSPTGAPFLSGEILPATPFVQQFVDVRGKPGPLGFDFMTGGSRNECTFSVTLADADDGQRIIEQVYAPGDLRPRGSKRMPCAIEVPSAERRAGRKLMLRIASDDAVEGHSWTVLCRSFRPDELDPHGSSPGTPPEGWRAEQGSTAIEGRLALQLDEDTAQLLFEEQVGSFAARRCPGAARFRSVTRAYAAVDDEAAWTAVSRPTFDPDRMVVLEGADPEAVRARGNTPESSRVEIVSEEDGRVHLRAQRAAPGWLVAAIAWYPGWRARVNGVETPLCCANYAFTGLALPAGESDIELEFAPACVRNGAVMSAVGLLGLLCMMGAAFASARARS